MSHQSPRQQVGHYYDYYELLCFVHAWTWPWYRLTATPYNTATEIRLLIANLKTDAQNIQVHILHYASFNYQHTVHFSLAKLKLLASGHGKDMPISMSRSLIRNGQFNNWFDITQKISLLSFHYSIILSKGTLLIRNLLQNSL